MLGKPAWLSTVLFLLIILAPLQPRTQCLSSSRETDPGYEVGALKGKYILFNLFGFFSEIFKRQFYGKEFVLQIY